MHARLRNGALATAIAALAVSWGLRDSEGLKLLLAVGGSKGALHLRVPSGSRAGARSQPLAARRAAAVTARPTPRTGALGRARSTTASRVLARSRAGTPPPSLHLDAPVSRAGQLDLTVTGFDPAPPREIDLWRVDGDERIWLDRSVSRANGEFTFSRLLFGGREVALVAAPRRVAPGDPSASPILWLRRPPVAPAISAITPVDETSSLRVTPAENSGAILIGFEATPRSAPTRLSVQTTREGLPRPLELAAPSQERCLWVVHELPDGRQSPARFHCGAPK